MSEETTTAVRKPLITVEQFRALARPTSVHLDEEEVTAYIRECEDEHIIPTIGWKNFKAATGVCVWDATFDDTFVPDLFLDGGEWQEVVSKKGEEETVLHYCNGIRKALAYFVYAKLLRADGTIISRSGSMRHRDDYSDHVDDSKLKQYNDTMSLAEMYLAGALLYLRDKAKDKQVKPARGTRAHIHAIGE